MIVDLDVPKIAHSLMMSVVLVQEDNEVLIIQVHVRTDNSIIKMLHLMMLKILPKVLQKHQTYFFEMQKIEPWASHM